MAAPYLVLTISGHTFPAPFPGSPSSPTKEQEVQSHGQKAIAHCTIVYSRKHPQMGACLQPEEHKGAAPLPAVALTHATGSGRGCLAISAFPSICRNTPYQQKTPLVGAQMHLPPQEGVICSAGRKQESPAAGKPSCPHSLIHQNSLAALCHHSDHTPELRAWLHWPVCDTLVPTECSLVNSWKGLVTPSTSSSALHTSARLLQQRMSPSCHPPHHTALSSVHLQEGKSEVAQLSQHSQMSLKHC